MSDDSSAQTYPCLSPDGCEFVAGGIPELTNHINSEHADEYQHDDWPDTEAGRQARQRDSVDGDK